MRSLHRLSAVASIALLAACQSDVAEPTRAVAAANSASHLLSPDQSVRYLVDSTDASGNHIMIAEWGAGALPEGGTVASVTIKTVVPFFTASTTTTSSPCITSTILKTEALPGWTTTVKKPGGCDKTIEVLVENRTTREKGVFSYLYIFGKTKIDVGFVR